MRDGGEPSRPGGTAGEEGKGEQKRKGTFHGKDSFPGWILFRRRRMEKVPRGRRRIKIDEKAGI
jgi:hypothetical protein